VGFLVVEYCYLFVVEFLLVVGFGYVLLLVDIGYLYYLDLFDGVIVD